MGIGDWGLGIGDWGLGPIPNPQSPIPNPQSPCLFFKILNNNFKSNLNKTFLSFVLLNIIFIIMEGKRNLNLYIFKIVFDNQIIQINYDTSFKEYNMQTIESLIKEVLKYLGPKPFNKSPMDYILFCPCGKQLAHNLLLSQSKCIHENIEDYSNKKNTNGNYLLIEKEKEEKDIKNKEYSINEIDKILSKIPFNKIKKKNKNINKHKNKALNISNTLKNKIKEFIIKEKRGSQILENSYELYYNENYYNDLIEMGFDENKVKAALRLSKNNKEDAVLICIDTEFYWDNKEYLYYDNNDVLTEDKFTKLCLEEIKKEYPFLEQKDIYDRYNDIIKKVK